MTDHKKSQVDLDNAREDDQVEVMKNIIEAGDCPFCLSNLSKYHKEPILKGGQYWILTPNQWPYKNTSFHLLAIYKNHAEDLSQLDPKSGEELLSFFQWAQREYRIPGGGWAMRFGDTNYSAGSVVHLHAQFIVPDFRAEGYQPTRFKIGKSPDKLERTFGKDWVDEVGKIRLVAK